MQKLNPWDVSFKEASVIQNELAQKICYKPLPKKISLIAGADVSYSKQNDKFFAAVVVIKLPHFDVVEVKTSMGKAFFPYVPGYLSFREIPVLLKAFKKLKNIPDAILCDGQGIAHPRKFGLASHLGLILNLPTVGCAKKRLVGEFRIPSEPKGSKTLLTYKNEKVGVVFRSKTGVKPIFVSPGNLVDLVGSVRLVKKCMGKYRIPEPTRLAHIKVNQARKGLSTNIF